MAASSYNSEMLLPAPAAVAKAFLASVKNVYIWENLILTLKRVLSGFGIALLVGMPLGFMMGYSPTVLTITDPVLSSVRQVPIMAWIPLTIVWFGLGDGPTVFLIAMVGVFPVILNTTAGVKAISKDYYNAARSMGASGWSIFKDIIVPAALPDILTGMRLAVGMGWMSVICAEFIATSAGFGYVMVEAQTRMETPTLMSLMVLAAMVGYAIDKTITVLDKTLTRWRYVRQ